MIFTTVVVVSGDSDGADGLHDQLAQLASAMDAVATMVRRRLRMSAPHDST
jgi:hypothetical protein